MSQTPSLRTIKLTIAYDGTAYAGWQLQPQVPTLQGTLEAALLRITGENIRTTASGRTDSGVHALGQVASFRTHTHLTVEAIHRALNAELPFDMAALKVEEAASGFDARRDAIGKRYFYVIHDGPVRDVFARQYAWQYRQRLDHEAMARAARPLIGTHDFRSFESHWPNQDSSVRTIFELDVLRTPDPQGDRVVTQVAGSGFLYNMVRAIVGTLAEVGRGVRPEEWPAQVLAAQDRSRAGLTAPAHGLFLERVDYPSQLNPGPP